MPPTLVANSHALSVADDADPLLSVMAQHLPDRSVVLELHSGNGQQTALFSRRFPHITWQPSDLFGSLKSINAWREKVHCHNFLPPLVLDVTQDLWPVKQMDAIFSANLINTLDWDKCRTLLSTIHRVLRPKGVVMFYGRFHGAADSAVTALPNDDSIATELQAKPLDAFLFVARRELLRLRQCITLPNNHQLIIFEK